MVHTKTNLFGAHVSIAGGLDKAFSHGEELGCTAIQIFTHSNRQWALKQLTDQEITTFKHAWKNSTIQSVVVHASYLLNLGATNAAVHKKTQEALIHELERCHNLGIQLLIIHPGSHGESSRKDCLNKIIETINQALEKIPGKTILCIENMAGQGTSVGSTLEELAYIVTHVKQQARIGICIDTCHAWAAGYSLATSHDYQAFWKQFDTLIGLNYLKALHLNDSKNALSSHVDRHEHIGKGSIGLEAFRLIMNDKNFTTLPKILETPHDKHGYGFKENLEVLRKLIKE